MGPGQKGLDDQARWKSFEIHPGSSLHIQAEGDAVATRTPVHSVDMDYSAWDILAHMGSMEGHRGSHIVGNGAEGGAMVWGHDMV